MIAHAAKTPNATMSAEIICGINRLRVASKRQDSNKTTGNRYVANASRSSPTYYTIGGFGF